MLLARIPSLSSFLPTVKPGVLRSTMQAVMPLWRAAGSIVAKTMKTSASFAFVIQSLRPLSTRSPPASTARVCSANASLPDPASDSAYAPTLVGGKAGQVALFQIVVAPAHERVDDQRVLDVHEDGDRRIHARQRLNRQNRVKERAAAAAVALGNLDAHHAEIEELWHEVGRKRRLVIHGSHPGADLGGGEFQHGIEQQPLIVCQTRKGRM